MFNINSAMDFSSQFSAVLVDRQPIFKSKDHSLAQSEFEMTEALYRSINSSAKGDFVSIH